ncbi:hypothetical protein [Litoreibacter roseus]|uniref:Uncharacterized protein n=1 Tax=Litoreibacter roseus TaxID=2601869 RepID=A0A6N6JNC1_9RHOB|nr:hypothetical protein [Litoreibacter roseus]GFE66812.1 hypothetical protein KIN_38860 [Litoreibacter roseus]
MRRSNWLDHVILTRRAFAGGLIGVTAFPRPSPAHHGFTGSYDSARPIYVAGDVIDASFRRPHPVIEMRVDAELRPPTDLREGAEFADILDVRAEDLGRIIDVEYPPIRLFFNLQGRIRVGGRIETIVYQNCRPPHQLRGQWLRLADGEAIVRRGRMQTEDAGCLS